MCLSANLICIQETWIFFWLQEVIAKYCQSSLSKIKQCQLKSFNTSLLLLEHFQWLGHKVLYSPISSSLISLFKKLLLCFTEPVSCLKYTIPCTYSHSLKFSFPLVTANSSLEIYLEFLSSKDIKMKILSKPFPEVQSKLHPQWFSLP